MASPLKKFELGQVVVVSREQIKSFPGQPREYFDVKGLEDLAASIAAVGQLQPILLRKMSNGTAMYELIDGQRRYHACGIAGIPTMQAVVCEIDDARDQFLLSVVANFGRADHTPLEIARAVKRIMDDGGLSVAEVARILGRSEPWAYQHLSLLRLHQDVRAMMDPRIPEKARLAFTVAVQLANLPPDLQLEIAKSIQERKMRLSEVRPLIRQNLTRVGIGYKKRRPHLDFRILRRFFERSEDQIGIFLEWPEGAWEKLFAQRSPADRARIVARIETVVDKLGLLRDKIGAPKCQNQP